jgi:hypothetical protein
MITYEVNLSVESSIAAEYEAWLVRHIEEILTIDGFIGADWHELVDEGSGRREYVVQYRLRDRSALESYFELHAERMRRDGTERFGGRFTATRRVMALRQLFGRHTTEQPPIGADDDARE